MYYFSFSHRLIIFIIKSWAHESGFYTRVPERVRLFFDYLAINLSEWLFPNGSDTARDMGGVTFADSVVIRAMYAQATQRGLATYRTPEYREGLVSLAPFLSFSARSLTRLQAFVASPVDKRPMPGDPAYIGISVERAQTYLDEVVALEDSLRVLVSDTTGDGMLRSAVFFRRDA